MMATPGCCGSSGGSDGILWSFMVKGSWVESSELVVLVASLNVSDRQKISGKRWIETFSSPRGLPHKRLAEVLENEVGCLGFVRFGFSSECFFGISWSFANFRWSFWVF